MAKSTKELRQQIVQLRVQLERKNIEIDQLKNIKPTVKVEVK